MGITWNRENRKLRVFHNGTMELPVEIITEDNIDLFGEEIAKIHSIGLMIKAYIKDVAIFGRPLSETEIRMIMGGFNVSCY